MGVVVMRLSTPKFRPVSAQLSTFSTQDVISNLG